MLFLKLLKTKKKWLLETYLEVLQSNDMSYVGIFIRILVLLEKSICWKWSSNRIKWMDILSHCTSLLLCHITEQFYSICIKNDVSFQVHVQRTVITAMIILFEGLVSYLTDSLHLLWKQVWDPEGYILPILYWESFADFLHIWKRIFFSKELFSLIPHFMSKLYSKEVW